MVFEDPKGIKPVTIWLTGLSGSGKTTLANGLMKKLKMQGFSCIVLDGDELRKGLCKDLSLSDFDRVENNRRAAEVAALFMSVGYSCICSFVSPLKEGRAVARNIIGSKFFEIYIFSSVNECQMRDPKGLYSRHKSGLISGLSGVDSKYEIPDSPDLVINTEILTVNESLSVLEGFFYTVTKSLI